MRASVWSLISAALMSAGFAEAAATKQTAPPQILLIVYNYAAMPERILQAARERVVRIFRDAGVGIVWSQPVVSTKDATTTRSRRDMFTVRVLIRRRQAARTPNRESVLAAALPAQDDGGELSLFYDEVLRVQRRHHQPVEEILAIALAHELGHILLPAPAHSSTGIMRASWEGDDIRHAVFDSLAFTAEQAELIRRKAFAVRP